MSKKDVGPSKSEQRVAGMGVREEEAAVLVEVLDRLDALEESQKTAPKVKA